MDRALGISRRPADSSDLEERLGGIRCALVTGATGFAGKHLVRFLQDHGVAVAGIARTPLHKAVETTPPVVQKDIEVLEADVRDLGRLTEIFTDLRPEYVYHLAGSRRRQSEPSDLEELVSVNIGGTANVLTAARAVGCERVLISGTAEEYGPIDPPFEETDRECPSNLYGASKLAATRLALAFGECTGLAVTVVRTTVAYGPGQSLDMLIGSLMDTLSKGRRFAMTEGHQKKDFIYISDVVEGIVRASLEPEAAGKILNMGSGTATSVREVAELAQKLAGKDGLLGFGELPMRRGEIVEYVVDMTTTTRLLGWSPRISLTEGLEMTLRAVPS
jgi:UDP-glucose 4-epimerase